MEVVSNATAFVSPLANADYKVNYQDLGFIGRIAAQFNGWTLSLAIFALAIFYDQCAQNLMEQEKKSS